MDVSWTLHLDCTDSRAVETVGTTTDHEEWGMHIVRFLDLIKPFVPLLPEVAAPERKVPFQQRLMWTGVSRGKYFQS